MWSVQIALLSIVVSSMIYFKMPMRKEIDCQTRRFGQFPRPKSGKQSTVQQPFHSIWAEIVSGAPISIRRTEPA